MDAIEITTHSDGCPACNEALKFLLEKTSKRESVIIVIEFENGKPHFHAPVSTVQFEKINHKCHLLK
jgi:hypothetical protein